MFAIAQSVGILAGLSSYPFEIIERRLQLQGEKPKELCNFNINF